MSDNKIVSVGVHESTGKVTVEEFPIPAPDPVEARDYASPLQFSDDQELFFLGSDIDARFTEYAVRTTNKEVKDAFDLASSHGLEQQKFAFHAVLKNVFKRSSSELNVAYEANSKLWIEWCNDVVLYFVYRKLVLNRDMPVVKM
jgi:hypothetical protein